MPGGYTQQQISRPFEPGLASKRLPLAVLLTACAIAVAHSLCAEPRNSPPEKHSETLSYKLPSAAYCGSLSCASASCHAAGDHGRPGSEYSTWVNGDPHFRSYSVLFEKASRDIVEKLCRRDGKPVPAHESAICLRCHAPSAIVNDAASARSSSITGVSCEDCHGPAEKYLTEHYRDRFKSLSRRDKAEAYGLFPTKDLAFRVTMCASCHVGDAEREVNHDLIAAGHPRLAFEYTGYHHWKSESLEWRHWEESAYGPDFEARAWEIGQVACARSAAELLRVRAQKAGKAPWPELAEYSCFACHKDLPSVKGFDTSRTPGSLPWANWYFATTDLAMDDPDAYRTAVARLGKHMEQPSRSRDTVVREAGELVARLDAQLRRLQDAADRDSLSRPYTDRQIARKMGASVRHALANDAARFADQDWDGLTQHYLASAAYYYAWSEVDRTGRDPQLADSLTSLGRALAFPRTYNSPRNTDPAELLRLFQRLRSDTPDPRGIK